MSDYSVSLLQPGEEKQWDLFLLETINSSFFNSLPFLNFYDQKVKEVLRFVFRRKNKIIALMAGGVVDSVDGLKFFSPYSSSFSGFCYGEHLSLFDAKNVITCLENYLHNKGIKEILIVQPPQCYYEYCDQRFDFLFLANDYVIVRNELTYFVTKESLSASGIWRNLKKADKSGLRFVSNVDIETVGEFLILHKGKRNLGLSTPVTDLVGLANLLVGKIHCHAVYSGDILVAAIIVYVLGKSTVMGFNWDQDYDFQHYRCTDFLLYKVISYYFDQGFTNFDLGTVTLNGEPNWGLLKFKEKLGGRGCLRTSYCKSLVNS